MSVVSVYDENARLWSYIKSFFNKYVIINVIRKDGISKDLKLASFYKFVLDMLKPYILLYYLYLFYSRY
jgi:hypothetical protein